MWKTAAIFRRESLAYFFSPIFYVAATFVTFMTGIALNAIVKGRGGADADIGYVPEMGGMLLLFIAPMLTMRLFAEEYKQGTMETLTTAPVTDWQIVLGKYLAACAVMAAMFIPSLVHLGVFYAMGRGDASPDAVRTVILYAVLLTWGAFYAALGLAASAFTRDQVVAAVLGLAVNFAFLIVHWWLGEADFVKNREALKAAVDYVNFYSHLQPALRGIVDTRDIVYFAASIVFLLFVTVRVMESRKWRG
ncbi:MAG TPA: hypothetical protein ENN09_02150 [Planctomycetes bacterium]|nr:hypothetical protein [Planctomycetota bacterium]